MPWDQSGNNNQQNPWNKRDNQGPPDLGDLFKKLSGKFGKKSSGKGSNNFGGIFLLILLIVAIFYVFIAFYTVDEKERAVVLRFGRYIETVGPGIHFYFPPLDKKYQENITNVRSYKHNASMLTKDENIVFVQISVQYFINNLKDYVLNIRQPEQSLQQATESALRHIVGNSEMDWVLKDRRDEISTDVKNRLQGYLDGYKSGLQIQAVNIEDSHPPQEVKDAFDDVFKAREDYERVQNEAKAYSNVVINEAEAKAIRAIADAKAYKAEVTEKSIGESSRFTQLLTEYNKAPAITKERLYLDAIQTTLSNSSKILVDTNNSNNLLYLPLDKLMQSSTSSETTTSPSTEIDLNKLVEQVIEKLKEQEQRNRERR